MFLLRPSHKIALPLCICLRCKASLYQNFSFTLVHMSLNSSLSLPLCQSGLWHVPHLYIFLALILPLASRQHYLLGNLGRMKKYFTVMHYGGDVEFEKIVGII